MACRRRKGPRTFHNLCVHALIPHVNHVILCYITVPFFAHADASDVLCIITVPVLYYVYILSVLVLCNIHLFGTVGLPTRTRVRELLIYSGARGSRLFVWVLGCALSAS